MSTTRTKSFEALYDFMTEKAATKEDLQNLATTKDIQDLEARWDKKFELVQAELNKIKPLEDNLSANVAETISLQESVKQLQTEVKKLQKNEVKRELYERKVNVVLLAYQRNATKIKRIA